MRNPIPVILVWLAVGIQCIAIASDPARPIIWVLAALTLALAIFTTRESR
jgi:hypothetical protein